MIGLAAGLLLPVAATGARVALGTVGMARDLARDVVQTFAPGQSDRAGVSRAGRAMGVISEMARERGCSITEMQAEDFAFLMERLAAFFAENGLDFEEGLEIALAEDGTLTIDHPEADAILSWLADDPELEGCIERAILTGTLLDTAERMQRMRAGSNPYAIAGSGDTSLRAASLRIAADGVEVRPA